MKVDARTTAAVKLLDSSTPGRWQVSQHTAQHATIVIIGAGPGGYAAAFHAADLGIDVTLIDPEEHPGGVCLYRGCIPSKALLHVARLINEAEAAAQWGITFEKPDIDLERLRSWKNSVVTKLVGGLGQLTKQRNVQYIQGHAAFVDSKTVEITRADKSRERISFKHGIIATGSRPAEPPGLAINGKRVVDSSVALELARIPDELLIVGGGYIGLEMASVYASLGSAVTIVEMMTRLLPGVDRDLISILTKRLKHMCKDILLNTKVSGMTILDDSVEVQFESMDDERRSGRFDMVLVAVGRVPNTQGFGLENTKVSLSDRGYIEVDGQRRTSDPMLFAIGDVAGEPMLAHKASHEGKIAVEAIAGKKSIFEPRAIPAVVFTDPEIAWCGLTEEDAKRLNRTIRVTRFPWAASGRAMTMSRTDGLTKLIIDPASERVLGMGITGIGAGELIAEGVLAIEMAAVAADIGMTIHPHPTLSETVMESADLFFEQATHLFRPRKTKPG